MSEYRGAFVLDKYLLSGWGQFTKVLAANFSNRTSYTGTKLATVRKRPTNDVHFFFPYNKFQLATTVE